MELIVIFFVYVLACFVLMRFEGKSAHIKKNKIKKNTNLRDVEKKK